LIYSSLKQGLGAILYHHVLNLDLSVINKKLWTTVVAICLTYLLGSGLSVRADEENDAGNWLLGIGVLANQTPYEDEENDSRLIPYIAYKTQNFQIGIDGASYRVSESDAYEAKLLADFRFDSYDPDESDRFDSIERDSTIEAGGAIEWKTGRYFIGAKALADVLDEHDGHLFKLETGAGFGIGGGKFKLSIGGIYRSEELNQYLFGVEANEATSELDAFDTDDSWSVVIEASYVKSMSQQSFVRASLSVESLDSDVRDSPRVDSDTDSTLLVLMIWQY